MMCYLATGFYNSNKTDGTLIQVPHDCLVSTSFLLNYNVKTGFMSVVPGLVTREKIHTSSNDGATSK